LGSIIAALLFPVAILELDTGRPVMSFAWPAMVTCALIILKHHENIRRLFAGTESRFGGKKSVPPPDAMEKQA
jgi:acyl phosphate:glycerol-3-phosphate acyltransferase